MSLSQRALLGGIGFVAFVMIVGAVWSRLTMTTSPQISGERSTLTPALSDFAGVPPGTACFDTANADPTLRGAQINLIQTDTGLTRMLVVTRGGRVKVR